MLPVGKETYVNHHQILKPSGITYVTFLNKFENSGEFFLILKFRVCIQRQFLEEMLMLTH